MDNQTIFIISKVNVYYVDIVEYPQRLRIKHLIPSRSKLRHSYLIFMAWTVCFGELKFIKILNYSIVTNTHKDYGYGVELTKHDVILICRDRRVRDRIVVWINNYLCTQCLKL
jgi:hypothetical protein